MLPVKKNMQGKIHCFFCSFLLVLLNSLFAGQCFFAKLDFFAISIYNMFISIMASIVNWHHAIIEVISAVRRVCDKPEDPAGVLRIKNKT